MILIAYLNKNLHGSRLPINQSIIVMGKCHSPSYVSHLAKHQNILSFSNYTSYTLQKFLVIYLYYYGKHTNLHLLFHQNSSVTEITDTRPTDP